MLPSEVDVPLMTAHRLQLWMQTVDTNVGTLQVRSVGDHALCKIVGGGGGGGGGCYLHAD